MEDRVGDKVYSVRTESEVWSLYFRHVLASLAGLIEGGRSRRWRLTQLGEEFLAASEPAQVWVLWMTWWTLTNWAIASPASFQGGEVPYRFIWQTLNHLLDVRPGEWMPFKAFANSLIEDAQLISPEEDPEEAKRRLRHTVRRVVMGPLADFGLLATRGDPERRPGVRLWLVSAFQVTPFGRGLLEATRLLLN
jgi:hypothetical protein